MKKPTTYPTFEQVIDNLAAWFEYYGPELMRRKLEKDNAAALEKQSLQGSAPGYTRLEVIALACLLVLYVLAGSAAPTVMTEAGTAGQGSNYHAF